MKATFKYLENSKATRSNIANISNSEVRVRRELQDQLKLKQSYDYSVP